MARSGHSHIGITTQAVRQPPLATTFKKVAYTIALCYPTSVFTPIG